MMDLDYSENSDVDDRAYRMVEEARSAASAGDLTSFSSLPTSSPGPHTEDDSKTRSNASSFGMPGAHMVSPSMAKNKESNSESGSNDKGGHHRPKESRSRHHQSPNRDRNHRHRSPNRDRNHRHRSPNRDRNHRHRSPHSSSRSPHRSNDAADANRERPRRSPSSTSNGSPNKANDGVVEVHAKPVLEISERSINNNNTRATNNGLATVTAQCVTAEHSITREDPNDRRRLCSNKTNGMIVVLLVIVLLIGAGVGAFFATRTATQQDDAAEALPTITNPPPPSSSRPNTSAGPTVAPITFFPATPGLLLLFDPPSAADCLAVQSGDEVDGQQGMNVRTFEVVLNVALSVDLSLDTVIEALILRTEENLIPVLVGCETNRRTTRRRLTTSAVNGNRYAIANAEMTGSGMESVCEEMSSSSSRICYTIVLKMDLFIKSIEVEDFEVAILLDDGFGGDLVDRLGLGASFRTIELTKIAPINNTPSLPPVNAPSTTTMGPVTNVPNPSPTPPPVDNDECGPSCTGNQSCEDFEDFTEVGCDSCVGSHSCIGMADGFVGYSSCLGDFSCSYLIEVDIGDNSCIQPYSCACLALGAVVDSGTCQNAGDCCTANGTPLNVPSSSCSGAMETCQFASGPIGSRSCTGEYRTCWGSKAEIGDDSCNDGGCTGLFGEVYSESCNGVDACPEGRDVLIHEQSCNCDGCCSCLTEPLQRLGAVFVPPGSCNSLAASDEEIDYDVDSLRPEDGPVTYCCSE